MAPEDSAKKQASSKTSAPLITNISDAFLRKTIYSSKAAQCTSILQECKLAEERLEKGASAGALRTEPPESRPLGAASFGAAGAPLWSSERKSTESAYPMYNPLASPKYDVVHFSQLRHTRILSSAVLPLVDAGADPAAQHLRLNEVLGLPKIHAHHLHLTREIMGVVRTLGGLQAVDEKLLWGYVAKEMGHQAEDAPRLRMYYIIVCYPFEQVQQVRQNLDAAPRSLLIAYIEPKKADILPEIVQTLVQKKKRLAKVAYNRLVATSAPLEVVHTLNYMYRHGVPHQEDLPQAIEMVAQFSCHHPEAGALYSCRDLLLVKEQLQCVVKEWLAGKIASLQSKDAELEKAVLVRYQHWVLGAAREPCQECGAQRMPGFFRHVLDVLKKSSALVLTPQTLEILAQLAQQPLPPTALLICLWNMLRASDPAMAGPAEIEPVLRSPGFAALGATVRTLLDAPLFSRSGMAQALQDGQLEVVLRILETPGGAAFVDPPMPALGRIWRYLVHLSVTQSLAPEHPHLADTLEASIRLLSGFLCRYLQAPGVPLAAKQALANEFDTEHGLWLAEVFSEKGDCPAVYAVCQAVWDVAAQE